MTYTIFSTEGCARCKILKSRMAELGIAYEDHDFKREGEGKEAFQRFYAANRKAIYRGPDGVEFPVLTDGSVIRQGVGAALAHLEGGESLNGFFHIGVMHKEWLDGIDISGGDATQSEKFLAVLRLLKKNAMKMVVETTGKNAAVLEAVLAEGLAEKVIMNVLGPLSMYSALAGEKIDGREVERAIALVSQAGDHQFQTVVAPVRRSPEKTEYMTPDEIGETAKLIATAAANKKQPYLIKFCPPGVVKDFGLNLEPMTENMFFPYRTAARAYQVAAQIEKEASGGLGYLGKIPCLY